MPGLDRFLRCIVTQRIGHAIAESSKSRAHAKDVKIASLALQAEAVAVSSRRSVVKGGQSTYADNVHLGGLGVEQLAPGVVSTMGEYAAKVATLTQECGGQPEAIGPDPHISGRDSIR